MGCCGGNEGIPPPPKSSTRLLTVPSPWQGLDRTGRPLIIGPEEDCDPGYFNNEVMVLLGFVPSP